MRIVHVTWDNKFVDMALRQFESAYPGMNSCYVITRSRKIRYVRSALAIKVSALNPRLGSLREPLQIADVIVFHSLESMMTPLPSFLPNDVPVIWIGFGYDYLNLIYDREEELYGPRTRELHRRLKQERSLPVRILRAAYRAYRYRGDRTRYADFFCPVLRSEYDEIIARHPDFRPSYRPWNYGTMEDTYPMNRDAHRSRPNDILIGNSASLTNNHADTFELLKEVSVASGRKLVVPLSYGHVAYRREIVRIGDKYFPGQFIPLTRFLPIEDYHGLLSSCRTVVMNHLRQQAMGNILAMTELGSTIFLPEEGPVYRFLKDEGLHVWSTNNLRADASLLERRLSTSEIDENRQTLRRLWGREAAARRTRDLIEGAVGG